MALFYQKTAADKSAAYKNAAAVIEIFGKIFSDRSRICFKG